MLMRLLKTLLYIQCVIEIQNRGIWIRNHRSTFNEIVNKYYKNIFENIHVLGQGKRVCMINHPVCCIYSIYLKISIVDTKKKCERKMKEKKNEIYIIKRR